MKEKLLRELNNMLNYYKACEQRYGNEQHDYRKDIKHVEKSIIIATNL